MGIRPSCPAAEEKISDESQLCSLLPRALPAPQQETSTSLHSWGCCIIAKGFHFSGGAAACEEQQEPDKITTYLYIQVQTPFFITFTVQYSFLFLLLQYSTPFFYYFRSTGVVSLSLCNLSFLHAAYCSTFTYSQVIRILCLVLRV